MTRRLFSQRLCAAALACALAAGCSHNEAPVPVVAVVTPTPATVDVSPERTPATTPPVVSARETPPAAAVRPQATAVQQVSYTTPAPHKDTTSSGAVLVQSAAKDSKPAFPRGESAPARRAIVDITAAGCFAHTDDYCWLVGTVDYSRLSNGWRLRYAGLDEADTYGGSVTLTGNIPPDGLMDGQHIRVKGHLQNPEDRGTSPAYHVDSFEVVQGPQ